MGLTRSADIIATKTGWGRIWVGALLLGIATSLPELATAAAASHMGAPNLATGNVFGANMLNISKLSLLMLVLAGPSVFKNLSSQQIWAISLALSLTIIATLFSVFGIGLKWILVSPASIILIFVYVFGSRIVFKKSAETSSQEPSHSSRSISWAWTIFFISALLIFMGSPLLAYSAKEIAADLQIANSFMGVITVAFITSMPELVVAGTALRIKAPDLAFALIYGTNAFNIVTLAIADFFFIDSSIFANLDNGSVIAGIFATILTSLGLIHFLTRNYKSTTSVQIFATTCIVLTWGFGVLIVFLQS
tara:strand:+ start:636 stop:1556 length:921 start_codon:yes stop_codon:yes gene_type:complete